MFSHINFAECKVSDLVEIILQLDTGMYAHLPAQWQKPGVAGLCAFRILGDALEKDRAKLSSNVKNFLDKINETTELLLKSLTPQTNIKDDINKLYAYDEGFKRRDYDEKEYAPYADAIKSLSKTAQLAYRESDGRFFALVDNDYLENALKIYGKKEDRSKIGLQHAHITLNEHMIQDKSQEIFKKFKVIATPEEFKKVNINLKYLAMKISFDVVGAYEAFPKTNSRMARTHQLHVESKEFKELEDKYGLKSEITDYRHHITFAEIGRKCYPGFEKLGPITEILGDNKLSAALKAIIGKNNASAVNGLFQQQSANSSVASSEFKNTPNLGR